MENINSGNYVRNVLRTESTDMKPIKDRLQDDETVRLLHAALGLVTEASEFADALKKYIFYGKPLNLTNLREEVGDSMWYAGLAIDILETTMNEVLTCNIEKLRQRYPDKFEEDLAINRNIENEMKHFK